MDQYREQVNNYHKHFYKKLDIFHMIDMFNTKADLVSVHHVLDIGCGSGIHVQFLAKLFPKAYIDGVDISPAMINLAKKLNKFKDRVNYHLADMHDLSKFKAERFDFIFSRNAIHYATSLSKVFSQINRVSETNSEFLFQDCHPFFTFRYKNIPNYFKKELVSIPIQKGKFIVTHPFFTFDE